jgi:hypothetical protein
MIVLILAGAHCPIVISRTDEILLLVGIRISLIVWTVWLMSLQSGAEESQA